jgi:hypothetical protein
MKIITLEYRIDSTRVTNLSFNSTETLLEADVVVVDVRNVSGYFSKAQPDGQGGETLLLRDGAQELTGMLERRRREVKTLLDKGKAVFLFVAPVVRIQAEKPGRVWVPVTNYSWLPAQDDVLRQFLRPGTGRTIILQNPGHPCAPYLRAFKDQLSYSAYLDMEGVDPEKHFLVNKANKPVTYFVRVFNGFLICLPGPPHPVDSNKLTGVLVQCARPLICEDVERPEPEWAAQFPVPGEAHLVENVEEIGNQIAELEKGLEEQKAQVKELTGFRALLYEKGSALEKVVLTAFELMGFKAKSRKEGGVEHDAILESPEGLAAVEIEGKDDDPIRIDKVDQLQRVVDEDFRVRDDDTYAKGILVGNPYRLTPPDEREDPPFTDKVQTAAKHKRFGLLATVDLFKAVVRILDDPTDEEFKKACRTAILAGKGNRIGFPLDEE